jgi:hypothetical protein
MTIRVFIALAILSCFTFSPTLAQTGTPSFNGSMAKLFGTNLAFSAVVEITSRNGSTNGPLTMPGKLAFLDGKARFELNMDQVKGGKTRPGAGIQLKALGMDKIVSITRPDKQITLQIYPGLSAYIETSVPDPDAEKSSSDFKIETVEQGRETLDGHLCVRNKSIVTDPDGTKHEALLWNATDIGNFPIKIQQSEKDTSVTMLFRDVSLTKPEVSLFEPPAGFTKYNDMPTMMKDKVLKRIGAEKAAAKSQP